MNRSELLWTQPGWRLQADRWIGVELERRDVRVTGTVEQPHVRPWATVLRIPTDVGNLFFKANMPCLAHEAKLAQVLYSWRPDCMVDVLAIDAQRGWMLMRDGGSTLRQQVQSSGNLEHVYAVFELYAEVQIALSQRVPELLKCCIDRRLAVFPAAYERLLSNTEALLVGQPDGLSTSQYEQLWALTSRVAELCERLSAYAVPETLQHDDFHDANVFVREGHYVLSDWGDSCVSHPFCSMLVGLRNAAYRYKFTPGCPEWKRLRDVYLAPWVRFEPRARLLEALPLAQHLGMISRALTWHRIVSHLEEIHRTKYATSIPGWLLEFLSAETRLPAK